VNKKEIRDRPLGRSRGMLLEHAEMKQGRLRSTWN